jgi:hypothetical protein
VRVTGKTDRPLAGDEKLNQLRMAAVKTFRSAKRWHDFLGEKPHGLDNFGMRNAAEIESRG